MPAARPAAGFAQSQSSSPCPIEKFLLPGADAGSQEPDKPSTARRLKTSEIGCEGRFPCSQGVAVGHAGNRIDRLMLARIAVQAGPQRHGLGMLQVVAVEVGEQA